MASVIPLPVRHPRREENIIASRPLEFRKACKSSMYFIQVPRVRASEFEDRFRSGGAGHASALGVPWGWELKFGRDCTIRGLFIHRESEETMRSVYYLAGLIDCMINQVSPLLRTDLLRNLYKETFRLKSSLDMDWSGRLDKVLMPIEPRYYSEDEYRKALNRAGTMKELYCTIREGTREMFDELGERYVFYCPGAGGCVWKSAK
jgi:hypothetical protein